MQLINFLKSLEIKLCRYKICIVKQRKMDLGLLKSCNNIEINLCYLLLHIISRDICSYHLHKYLLLSYNVIKINTETNKKFNQCGLTMCQFIIIVQ